MGPRAPPRGWRPRGARRPSPPNSPQGEPTPAPRGRGARATELTLAFRAATDRAVEFQAVAAAQLADPRRFDRLTPAAIAERAEWTEDYAKKMIEFGRELLHGGEGRGSADPV
ncbi:hypothetical protein ACFWH4_17815 [Streptomyces sp. NPDC127091]|uniref:hypothetical protein n=1 Tax=Streptomyces sp. NPDC127091 TaxID=3347134 RepID=UPI003656D8B7